MQVLTSTSEVFVSISIYRIESARFHFQAMFVATFSMQLKGHDLSYCSPLVSELAYIESTLYCLLLALNDWF